MAFNFNKVMIGGRLTADPELKTTQSGLSVTSFTVAVNRRAKAGEEQKADFFNVTAWRGTAEFVTRFFHKGSSIMIVGSLQNRSWERDGHKRTVTEIVADEAHFVDSRSSSEGGGERTYVPDAYTQAPKLESLDGSDEEIPF